MSKKYPIIAAISLAIAVITIVGITNESNSKTFELDENFNETLGKYSKSLENTRHPKPSPILDAYEHKASSIDEAIENTDVDVKKPTILPENFELKTIVYSNKDSGINDIVSQFYMLESAEFDETTSLHDVLDKGGFVIIQVNKDPAKIHELPDKIGDTLTKFSTVGESKAMIMDGDKYIGLDSQIMFYKENVFVNLVSVSFDTEDLLVIANSMY